MTGQLNITEDVKHLTAKTEPTVTVKDAISFHRDGERIAGVDAVYDFSKLPPEHHGMALQLISMHQPRAMMLPSRRPHDLELQNHKRDDKTTEGFWARAKRILLPG